MILGESGLTKAQLSRRFGGALYWSLHLDGSQKFYKQIARFYPTDPQPRNFTGHGQLAQSRMILALSARYEALVKILVENGQITEENGEALMSEEWKKLIDDDRKVIMRSKLTEVDDAERELD